MAIVISERELLIAVALTALVYVLLLLGLLLRRHWRGAAQTSAPHDELAPLRAELSGLRQRVEQLEAQIARGAEVSAEAPDDPVYASADRLIKQGLSADEVAGRLGLSRAEVDLIAVLQRDKGVPGQ